MIISNICSSLTRLLICKTVFDWFDLVLIFRFSIDLLNFPFFFLLIIRFSFNMKMLLIFYQCYNHQTVCVLFMCCAVRCGVVIFSFLLSYIELGFPFKFTFSRIAWNATFSRVIILSVAVCCRSMSVMDCEVLQWLMTGWLLLLINWLPQMRYGLSVILLPL